MFTFFKAEDFAEMFEQKSPEFRIFHDNSAYSRTRVKTGEEMTAAESFARAINKDGWRLNHGLQWLMRGTAAINLLALTTAQERGAARCSRCGAERAAAGPSGAGATWSRSDGESEKSEKSADSPGRFPCPRGQTIIEDQKGNVTPDTLYLRPHPSPLPQEREMGSDPSVNRTLRFHSPRSAICHITFENRAWDYRIGSKLYFAERRFRRMITACTKKRKASYGPDRLSENAIPGNHPVGG